MNPRGALNLETHRTFSVVTPPDTHTEPATCEQVNCQRWSEGFAVLLDTSTQGGRDRYDWIYANPGGRQWYRTVEGDVTRLDYPPGNRCYDQHRRILDKPAVLLVRKGAHSDRRVVDRLPVERRHVNGADFMDDLRTHTDSVLEHQRKG